MRVCVCVVRGPRSWCYGRTAALWLIVQPCDEDEDEDEQFFYQVVQVMEHQCTEIDRGKPTTRRKTCPSATLSTTNRTWTDPVSNTGIRGERPATNRLSHGTALEEHPMNQNNKSKIRLHVTSNVLRKSVEFVFQCAEVCPQCWGDTNWAADQCKDCMSIAFSFGDITV
jgi:hypothetical protein